MPSRGLGGVGKDDAVRRWDGKLVGLRGLAKCDGTRSGNTVWGLHRAA